jgi:hypothetical protein
MTERELPLEELLRAWVLLPWYHRKAIAIAIIVRHQTAVITNMGKVKVGYLILVTLLASCTGVLIFVNQGNAIMSAIFGGMVAATIVATMAYLVWYYFH